MLARLPFMKARFPRPSARQEQEIAQRIAASPDIAPDLSAPHPGIALRLGRPPKRSAKIAVTLRLDPDVIAKFKATGEGWQTRINAALKSAAAK